MIVSLAHTIVQPVAMMVEFIAAVVAGPTVFCV